MATRTATGATLLAALRASRPGDVIVTSGEVNIDSISGFLMPNPGVVVKAAPGATLRGWPRGGVSGITFSGFRTICATSGRSELGLKAAPNGWVAIEDCIFTGATPDLEAAGSGLVMMGCVKTRRCTFSKMLAGISIQGGADHLVEDCQFSDLWHDAISGNAGPRTVIRRNYFTNFRGPSVHLDCIQLIKSGTPNDGIVIEGNVYERGTGTPAQGVFTDSATGVWTIRGNAFLGGPWQTIAIYGAKPGTIIEDNFLQGFDETAPGKQVMTPWIKVHNAPGAVIVRNNVTTGMNNVNAPNVELVGNKTIQNAKLGDRSALVEWMKGRNVAAPAKRKAAAVLSAPTTLADAAVAIAVADAALRGRVSRRWTLAAVGAQAFTRL